MASFVLFVDDEAKILVSLERELDDWLSELGLVFRSAESVDAALAILGTDAGSCAALVSDLKMPQRKGSELLLECQKRYPWIGSVLLTGFSEMDEIKDCIRAGIVSFVQKPWNHALLQAEVGRAIELTRLRNEHDNYLKQLETDFVWTRKLHRYLLLNKELPAGSGALSIGWQAAKGTYGGGGDLFLVIPRGEKRLMFCFGTLEVQGVEGTLHGARVRDHLLGLASRMPPESGPSWLLEAMNNLLVERYPDLPTGSMSLGIYDMNLASKSMQLASAGGEHFGLISPGGVDLHTLPSPVLGLKAGIIYNSQYFAWETGTILALVSRGFIDVPGLRTSLEELLGHVADGCMDADAQALLDQAVNDKPTLKDATLVLYCPC